MIYADFAAATPTDPKVWETMSQTASLAYANPSSRHQLGQAAHRLLQAARQTTADFLAASNSEIYFTASGTEANNLAILGVAKAAIKSGNHIITSNVEHPSISHALLALKKIGYEVTYLPVDQQGLVSPRQLAESLTDKTIFITIHLANSVTGVIQPIKDLTAVVANHQALFHTDACSGGSFLDLSIKKLGVDLLSFNGSKMYGPKGTAVLYVKDGTPIFPLVYGGGQEGSLRSGTENLPAIVGLAKAIEIVGQSRSSDYLKIGRLRDRLELELGMLAGVSVGLADSPRLPNHLLITLDGYTGTNIVEAFDRLGVAVSAGSACSSYLPDSGGIFAALGFSSEQANATVRISLGRSSTLQELDKIVAAVKKLSRPV
ncbi:MAG: cysteine desulfurase family protein [Patescibacteria group bacterium]